MMLGIFLILIKEGHFFYKLNKIHFSDSMLNNKSVKFFKTKPLFAYIKACKAIILTQVFTTSITS